MSKKFKQILEGKHKNHTRRDLSDSTGYIIVHEICTDKNLEPDLKMRLIDGFCQNVFTVSQIAEYFVSENLNIWTVP